MRWRAKSSGRAVCMCVDSHIPVHDWLRSRSVLVLVVRGGLWLCLWHDVVMWTLGGWIHVINYIKDLREVETREKVTNEAKRCAPVWLWGGRARSVVSGLSSYVTDHVSRLRVRPELCVDCCDLCDVRVVC